MNDRSALIKLLLEINCFKFGEFTLKSGTISPIYIDLRSIISYPDILMQICNEIMCLKNSSAVESDLVCGVPYTALPIATVLSVTHNIPLLLKRKEAKDYGTKKILEGIYAQGEKCLIIEDIVTSGSSVLETVNVLRVQGLVVTDCVVILDREQGAEANLTSAGVKMHSLLKLSQVIDYLSTTDIVTEPILKVVMEYLEKSKSIKLNVTPSRLPFSQIAEMSENAVLKKLCHIITEKKTNLCVAVDVSSSQDLLNMAEQIGPYICILKTHIDVLEDFEYSVIENLKALSKQHNFLILEDRKFADIGNTVLHQYEKGLYKIRDWADLVTVHTVSGKGVIEALKKASDKDRACLLIAQMSSQGSLISGEYTENTVKLAESHKDFAIGFISQSRLSQGSFLHVSPGVHLTNCGDNLGQQYRTVEEAIVRDGVDIIIVGRGITESSDVIQATQQYRSRAYATYESLISQEVSSSL